VAERKTPKDRSMTIQPPIDLAPSLVTEREESIESIRDSRRGGVHDLVLGVWPRGLVGGFDSACPAGGSAREIDEIEIGQASGRNGEVVAGGDHKWPAAAVMPRGRRRGEGERDC
jgi:hypothetical protein